MVTDGPCIYLSPSLPYLLLTAAVEMHQISLQCPAHLQTKRTDVMTLHSAVHTRIYTHQYCILRFKHIDIEEIQG